MEKILFRQEGEQANGGLRKEISDLLSTKVHMAYGALVRLNAFICYV
jgi:hypothetical protein